MCLTSHSRRLYRGLQVLFAIIILQNSNEGVKIGRRRARLGGCAQGKGERLDEILHGCSVEGSGGEEKWV